MKKVLAISSGGGHWIELLRLTPAFENASVVFATVEESYIESLENRQYSGFFTFTDATQWDKVKLIAASLKILAIVIQTRPDIVVSTGALPGYIAIRIGKMIGARTIWLDSIANAGELSKAGRYVAKYADLYLTQWEHLSKAEGPYFKGTVL